MFIVPITLAALGSATCWDLKTNRIPNLITLPTIASGIILNIYYSGLAGFEDALVGMLLGILLLILPFVLGGIGAGDVKLLAAVGALNGSSFVFQSFLYSAIAGGVIALGIAVSRGILTLVLINLLTAFRSFSIANLVQRKMQQNFMPVHSNLRFPYGIAILAGSVLSYVMR